MKDSIPAAGVVVFILFLAIRAFVIADIRQLRREEGIERAKLINYLHGVELTPEQAQTAQVIFTSTDVQLSIEQLTILP